MNIMFVCTGNTCRSPMAGGLFQSIDAEGSFEVGTAGISTHTPSPASENAVTVMAEMGVDISDHESRQITKEHIADADLILTMTSGHRNVLVDLFPQYSDKIFSLCEYAYGTDDDVSDPYGGDVDVYRHCATQLKDAVSAVYDKITSKGGTV